MFEFAVKKMEEQVCYFGMSGRYYCSTRKSKPHGKLKNEGCEPDSTNVSIVRLRVRVHECI